MATARKTTRRAVRKATAKKAIPRSNYEIVGPRPTSACRKIGLLTLTGFGGGPGRAWTITPTKPRGWQDVFRKWRNYRMRCRCS